MEYVINMRKGYRELPTTHSAYACRSGFALFLTLLFCSNFARAQSPLPFVDGVDGPVLKEQSKKLLEGLEKLGGRLPDSAGRDLRAFLKEEKSSDATAEHIQKLLNEQCLVGVSINPESRVKAARGPRPAELVAGKNTIFLIRVVNEAGVTHALSLEGPQIIKSAEKGKDGWLHASVYPEHPSSQKLSGQKVE